MAETISNRDALDDLSGTHCKGCGGTKRRAQTFCRECYFALPNYMQTALYKRVYEGYAEAYTQAISWFDTRKGAA